QKARRGSRSVAHAHFRYFNPLPRNTGEILRRFRRILAPELNRGQLRHLLRSEFLLDVAGLSKLQGRPFLVSEIEARIQEELGELWCVGPIASGALSHGEALHCITRWTSLSQARPRPFLQ